MAAIALNDKIHQPPKKTDPHRLKGQLPHQLTALLLRLPQKQTPPRLQQPLRPQQLAALASHPTGRNTGSHHAIAKTLQTPRRKMARLHLFVEEIPAHILKNKLKRIEPFPPPPAIAVG
ncbi:MAG: hypothetical protein MH825_15510 [Cyanobacteria bacterium]|nr:hypothetical protein [Cyanobacteriota bacterium]